MSPATPLPPIPSTTTFSMVWRLGSPSRSLAASAASATCSGRPAVTSNIPSVSSTPSGAPMPALAGWLEGGRDAIGIGLGQQTLMLGVVDRLGFVDQHHRNVIPDGVTPLQPGVVKAVFVLEVQERALV